MGSLYTGCRHRSPGNQLMSCCRLRQYLSSRCSSFITTPDPKLLGVAREVFRGEGRRSGLGWAFGDISLQQANNKPYGAQSSTMKRPPSSSTISVIHMYAALVGLELHHGWKTTAGPGVPTPAAYSPVVGPHWPPFSVMRDV